MMNPDMKEYLEMYLEESANLLKMFEDSLNILASRPDDKEALKVGGRSMHTFASNSAVLGLDNLLHLGRELEYYFDDLAAKNGSIKPAEIDAFKTCHKTFSEYLALLKNDPAKEEPVVSGAIKILQDLKK